MDTCNCGGPFGLIVAHSVPSGPRSSLSFWLLALTTTHDNSVAHLRPIFATIDGIVFCSIFDFSGSLAFENVKSASWLPNGTKMVRFGPSHFLRTHATPALPVYKKDPLPQRVFLIYR